MQWEHLLHYPAPGRPSAYWTTVPAQGFGATLERVALGATHRLKMNHVVTRLMDMLGVGDNHLAILQKPREDTAAPAP